MTLAMSNRGLLLAAAATFVGLVAMTPAWAGDDGQEPMWQGIGGLLGLTPSKFDDPIDYRERPRLVLPPKADLPAPAPSQPRTAAWPQDPDLLRVQKEKADYFRSLVDGSTGADRSEAYAKPLSPTQLRTSRVAAGHKEDPRKNCNSQRTNCGWVMPDFLEKFGLKKEDDAVVAGQEPDRDWLTDPPKGYRLPAANTKATFDAKNEVNQADPRAALYKAPAE